MNQITFQSVYQVSTTANFDKGERAVTPDGRKWVYVKAQSALAKGSVAIPAAVTTLTLCSSSTDALGRIVYVTKAAAGWTVGQFEDAIIVVVSGTGAGQTAKVQTNDATTLTLYPETALGTALAVGDSAVTIRTMSEVVKSAVTSPLQSAVGIAQVAFTAADFGWLLTDGDGVVLAGNTLIIGAGFTTGDDTTGQVIKSVITEAPLTAQNLGICLVANGAVDIGALVRVAIR